MGTAECGYQAAVPCLIMRDTQAPGIYHSYRITDACQHYAPNGVWRSRRDKPWQLARVNVYNYCEGM